MVKNKKGGSGHKKMARKFVNNNSGPRKLRKAKVKEGEIYAKVLQMYGNGMCNVICMDNVERLCIIRKRFKGRNKRDNTVAVNSVLLVGIRSWELISNKKKPKVDLLYIYSSSGVSELMKDDVFNSIKWPDDGSKKEDQEKGNIEFTHQMDYGEEDEVDNFKLVMNKKTDKYTHKPLKETKKASDDDKEVEEINWDDI